MRYALLLLLWVCSISVAFSQSDTTATQSTSGLDEPAAQEAAPAIQEASAAAAVAANESSAPTQAPSQDLFSLDRDQVGMFQNSVNLFTGEIAFSLPLVSLPGRGGLNAGLALAYNSAGVRQQAKTWNLTAPTGVAGLGWQLNIPHIVVDNKQTGTREDDDFFLVEGGVSNPLVLTGSSSQNGDTYQSTNYKFWIIKYEPDAERWTITREDGSQWIYGDPNSERNTVQYVVRWDNWIGNSAVTTGQSQQAMRWDLSEVQDIYGNTLTYAYEQVSRPVGSGGEEHTEASYLSKITNPQGQTVTLIYEDKAANEYQEPHTERIEPDAYQERYERRAIDKLEVRDELGALRYTLDMEYGTTGSGNFTKRLLTSVQKIGQDGSRLPPMLFNYEGSGNTAGALSGVVTSQGGNINYTRTEVSVSNASRNLTISAPTGGYAESQTWMGPDYVVVAWRQLASNGTSTTEPRTVKLSVYQWAGRWVEQFRQTIGQVSSQFGRYKDFEVITRPEFFAVRHKSSLFLSHKDKGRPGYWTAENTGFTEDNQPSRLIAGDDFLVVGGYFLATGELSAWRWDGDSWVKETFNLPEGEYAYTAANNYFIAHNNDANPDQINLFYIDKKQRWRRKTASPINSFTSGAGGGAGARSVWSGTNAFAAVLADANEEFIYQWGQDYTLKKKVGILGSWSDLYPAFLTGNNMVGIDNAGEAGGFRYDGVSWNGTGRLNYNRLGSAFGEDFFVWHQGDGVSRIQHYNPNTRTWGYTSMPGESFQDVIAAGNNMAFYGDDFYYRNTDGAWNLVYTVPSIGNWVLNDFRSGPNNTVAISTSAQNTYVMRVINGEVQQIGTLPGQSVSRVSNGIIGAGEALGPNILVTFPTASGVWANARSLTLHRIVDDQLTGTPVAYPVTAVTMDGGQQPQYISYRYTTTNATVDANSSLAQFNEVRTVYGTSNANSAPHGYTLNYFFNGRSSSEASLPFPSTGASGAFSNYGKFQGLPYAAKTYNQSGSLVASSESYWKVYGRDLSRVDGIGEPLFRADYAQVIRQEASRDGVAQTTTYDYGSDGDPFRANSVFRHGQLRSMTTTDSEGRTRRTQYQYAEDSEVLSQYNSELLRDAHIINQPLTQTVTVGGTTVQRSETYYQAQSNPAASPVPEKTVAYPRGGNNSITVNYRYDDYGNLVESNRTGGLTAATLWGYNHSRPVAQSVGVSYATLSGRVSPGSIQNLDGEALQQALNPLRSLTGAQVTTYSYDRLYGATIEADPNDRSTTYHYNDISQLEWVESEEGHVVQKFEYQYTSP